MNWYARKIFYFHLFISYTVRSIQSVAMENMLLREDEAYRDRASQRSRTAQNTLAMESAESAHVDHVLAQRDEHRKQLSRELISKVIR